MRKNKKCLFPLLSVFNQFIPGKMERVRKTTQVIRREWHCPAGNSSEQMDLPLYKYLIVFLIKGTQSNSVTCVQAGKEKSLSFNIKLAPFKFTPLREQQLRGGGGSYYHIEMFKEEQKKCQKNAIFRGSPGGQEQFICPGASVHTQPDLPSGLGVISVSVSAGQTDVYVVGH